MLRETTKEWEKINEDKAAIIKQIEIRLKDKTELEERRARRVNRYK